MLHACLVGCRLLRLNPEAAVPAFPQLCGAFASWRHIALGELRAEMASVLQSYKGHLSASGKWDEVLATVPQPVKTKLAQMGFL